MPDTENPEAPVRYPGNSDEAHPELFNLSARPPHPEKKPGQLSDEQIRQYFEEGYVLVEDFFPREMLDACRESIKVLVENLAERLHQAGKITSLHKDKGLFQRLTAIEKEYPGANIILHKQGIMPQEIRDLWTHDRLLNVVEQLIGPDIAGHPVWNLRTKTPKNEATTVPWHQDSAYLSNESYTVHQATAWIPLLDANESNGCMQMVRRGHKTGKIATHQCCYGNTWYVMLEPEEMERSLDVNVAEDVVTCPVPYGGMLLFSNMIPHRSLNNLSNDIRWSLDLRWQNPEKPVGFYGLKEGVLMRTSKDPNHVIDWDTFMGVDRTQAQSEAVGHDEADLDTTIHGPWMKKWEVVHMNHHTATLTDDKTSWHGTINP